MFKDANKLKIKGWKVINHANSSHKKAEMVTLISDKIDYKTKNVTRNNNEHFIIIKRSTHQKYIRIMICISNNKASIPAGITSKKEREIDN